MYYDSNNIQLSTKVDEVMTENVAMKYEAWGWNVLSIDGHNINEIREALVAAESETERPTLIIGHTVMGKGAKGPAGESFENKVSTPRPAADGRRGRFRRYGEEPGRRCGESVRRLRGGPRGLRRTSRGVEGVGREAGPPSRSRGARSIRIWRANSTISFRANFPKSTTSPSR